MNNYEQLSSDNRPRNIPFNRSGGNRWTAYNWENNASNAGSDWGPYSSDNALGASNTLRRVYEALSKKNRAIGMASLITVQLQGMWRQIKW